MSAKIQERRKKTAKELAAKFGVTPRAIVYNFAEPREDFVKRASEKTEKIVALRLTGKKFKDIAEELDLPLGTVCSHVKKARSLGLLPKKDI